ncbi:MAG TPA: glycine cleavage system aminomethyltransferase GcvT [Usitatibacter sp.]|jgi:aminomethyltransferase|nr:glycine cleavage system aminomethyltransferase GcvT [Usitatibacter sp.]
MPKTTPLHATHLASGARMVDFGGWDMPLHYGSQIDEHHAVRRDAGLFDVSHMLALDVEGRGARAFLRHALANDVDRLKAPGKALYSCVLNDAGGVIDDLIVYALAPDRYRVVVNAGTADKDLAWLEAMRVKIAPHARLTPRRDLAMIAVQGPSARERTWNALPALRDGTRELAPFHAHEAGGMLVARTGYTGEDGFELTLPAADAVRAWEALVAAGATPCGLGARDTLRLEAGMNLYGQDMDESVSPLDAGLAWTIDSKPGRDFVGRAALERSASPAVFAGLVLLEAGGVLRAHQVVETACGEGTITSGTFSPTLGKSIALARLPAGTAHGETVRVRVRDKHLAARVVKLPFVRQGRVLINLQDEEKETT